ncbi:MAG: SpoIIE family protein phosphatase [Clostridiales bacterium]|nr:SpoIIE family protein phosphatase [Clostridiales bacterium]
MLSMIFKMSAVTAGNILITFILWKFLKNKKMNWGYRLLVSAVFAGLSILATHYGIDYQRMMINVRDLAPLAAGLFFDPIAGIIAGLVGGIERYIAGTYWGVGTYTTIACSVSTCLSGIVAALLRVVIFKGKKPALVFAYFIGSTMEVFHMYVVFITHRNDMEMAYSVVKTCAPPMIVFTGLGLAVISFLLRIDSGEWVIPKNIRGNRDIKVSQRFQFWLFLVSAIVLLSNLVLVNILQTQVAIQDSYAVLQRSIYDIGGSYNLATDKRKQFGPMRFNVGSTGNFAVMGDSGLIDFGEHSGKLLDPDAKDLANTNLEKYVYLGKIFGRDCAIMSAQLGDGQRLLVYLPDEEVFKERDQIVYETILADILLFTVIYILISVLVQKIVVNNLEMVNESLRKITDGNLNEVVSVYSSSEFASLSNDINQTVDVLKRYISEAEKRIEQELEFAKNIQESALPHNFSFPRNDFEIYASMDAAKEVGGDFYDFFFVDVNKICLVIADVSGKGIPAALFMMRSKTVIRGYAESGKSPSEIFSLANNGLCEGNDANMFVTVWIGIIDLETGHMVCSNAGHEIPAIMRAGGAYELYKQKHNLALGIFADVPFREYEIDLAPGDSLFVYTDGAPEAINEKQEEYGTGRLIEELNKYKLFTQKDILTYTRKNIAMYVGEEEQFDDVTMLGFKYNGPPEK